MAKLMRLCLAAMVALGIVAGNAIVDITPVFADPITPQGSLNLPGAPKIQFSPPTLADLNNDGRREILVGTVDGRVFALQYTDTVPRLSVLWSHDTAANLGSPTAIRGAISAADLDGNSTVEIVVPVGDVFSTNTYGGLVVLDSNGALLWSYRTYDHTGEQLAPDGRSDGVVGAPALGDLDNDGTLEIVLGSFDHRIYAFHHDGRLVSGWPKFIRDTVWTSPALADLDNDGHLEIVIGVDTHREGAPFNTPNGGGLYVFRGDGRVVDGWPQFIGQVIYSSPAVGDLDGDGQPEIVHGTGDFFNNPSAGYKVYAWDRHGNLRWTGSTSGFTFASPALGDIDGDGRLEVVSSAMDGRVYAWNHDGSPLWNVMPTNFQGNTYAGLQGSPALADYNGDGRSDVFINVFWDAAVLDGSTGNQITANFFPGDSRPAYVSGFTVDSAPALGDIDGDGKLELVLGSADNSGNTGQVVHWDLDIPDQLASAPWPMFGRNARHTNVYAPPQDLAAEVVLHTIPAVMGPGTSKSVSITMRNTGTATWRAGGVSLGAVGDSDPLSPNTRVALDPSDAIAPGQTKTFRLTLTAPSTEGYATTDWRMVRDAADGGWFGRTVKVEVKVGNQPALHVLSTQGMHAGGLATTPFPAPSDYTDWPAVKVWKLTFDRRGYYMLDRLGGFWYGGTFPLFAKGQVPGLQDMVLGPDGISYYELLGDGTVYGCNTDGCDLSFTPAPPTGIQARSLALTPDGKGVYVVDGFGNLYTGGNAPSLALPSGLPATQDIVRRIKLTADGKGFYLMDIYGRVWNGGSAPALTPGYSPKVGEDWARDFELTEDGEGFYLLDRYNTIHAGGTAEPLRVNVPPTATGDVGRDLELVDSRRTRTPLLDLSSDSFGILHQVNSSTPVQAQITLENKGAAAFTWQARAVWQTAADLPAISLTPSSGTLAPSQSQTVKIEIGDPGALSMGTHTANLEITAIPAVGGESTSRTASMSIFVVEDIHYFHLPLLVR